MLTPSASGLEGAWTPRPSYLGPTATLENLVHAYDWDADQEPGGSDFQWIPADPECCIELGARCPRSGAKRHAPIMFTYGHRAADWIQRIGKITSRSVS